MDEPTRTEDAAPPPPPTSAPPPREAPGGAPRRVEPWQDRARWERAGDTASIVWGLILLAVGAWLFVEITLGYDLPTIPWRDLWPLALILIGGWIVLRAARRPT